MNAYVAENQAIPEKSSKYLGIRKRKQSIKVITEKYCKKIKRESKKT